MPTVHIHNNNGDKTECLETFKMEPGNDLWLHLHSEGECEPCKEHGECTGPFLAVVMTEEREIYLSFVGVEIPGKIELMTHKTPKPIKEVAANFGMDTAEGESKSVTMLKVGDKIMPLLPIHDDTRRAK